MIALSTERLSLSFGATPILTDVSFAADESDRIGIIGSNGCGKSTLFKLILGEYTPDSGSVYISKGKSVGILRQEEALSAADTESGDESALELTYRSFPELLAAQARLSELERALADGTDLNGRTHEALVAEYSALNDSFIRDGGLEFKGRCLSTLMKMGFDKESVERPVSSFSGGQRTRLALSRELCREPDVLMLDEPTNHLDIETLGWLESFLATYKKCVLVISHDRYFLDRVTNKTLLIENHRAKLYGGGYTKSLEQRRRDRELQEKHYRDQQKEIARQEAYIAQQRAWNRERNIIAAESREKLLAKLERVERPDAERRSMSFGFSSSVVGGNDVMTLYGVGFGYPSAKPLFENVSLTVKRGDRLFVAGPNGCGKSTLIKLLVGRLAPTSGYIETGYNVSIGYYDQENQRLSASNTVVGELGADYPTLTELELRSTLARFGFVGDSVYKLVGELSGGEKARLTLAKLMLSDINLLVLDEPTNHLDIDSKEALEAALSEFSGTVIAVSHDRYFLGKLATRLLDLDGRGAVDIYVRERGAGYEELCRDRQRREALSAEAEDATDRKQTAVSSGKELYIQSKKQAAEDRRARRLAERLSEEAKRLEAELERIEREMNGDAACDYVRLAELDTKKNELEERLLEIYETIGV